MQRVLIAEDEVLIGLVLEDMLGELGCAVAHNAESFRATEAALGSLGADGFDLAILDVNLGDEPVYPLADRIAALGKPIVFSTGSHRDTLPVRFQGSLVLEKPYSLAAVDAAVRATQTVA